MKTAALLVATLLAPAEFAALSGPYLGQEAPRERAGLFLDGVISMEDAPEMSAAFSEDGRELYYCARHEGRWAIFVTREEHGRWQTRDPWPSPPISRTGT